VNVVKADDESRIQALVGTHITVEGKLTSASLTAARNALNLELAGGLLVWIPPPVYAEFQRKIGGSPDQLIDQTVLVSGRLSKYGGHRSEWRDRLQVTLDDASRISLVAKDAKPSTAPSVPTKSSQTVELKTKP
jgi:hypothetical protein